MNYMNYYDDIFYRKSIRECVINGVRKPYDACSSNSLEYAIHFYRKSFVYIGSNNGEIYINGTLNNFNAEHHFFVRGNLNELRKDKLAKLNLKRDDN